MGYTVPLVPWDGIGMGPRGLSIHNRGQVKARPSDPDRTSQSSDSYWCTLVWNIVSYIYLFENYVKQRLDSGCVLQTQPITQYQYVGQQM